MSFRRATVVPAVLVAVLFFLSSLSCDVSLAGNSVWLPRARVLPAVSEPAVAVVGSDIYLIGGYEWVSTGPGVGTSSAVSQVSRYRPGLDAWDVRADMPDKRYGSGAAVVDGRVYVLGGRDGMYHYHEVFSYNPAIDLWAYATSIPVSYDGMGIAAVSGKVYAIGGGEGYYSTRSVFSTVQIFDPPTGTWTSGAPMPTPRGDLAAVVVGDKIYAIGGNDGNWNCLDSVESYDPVTDTWTVRANMPTSLQYVRAVAFNAGIEVMRHGGTTGIEGTMHYSPTTDTWSGDVAVIPGGSLPAVGYVGCLVSVDAKLFAWPAAMPGEGGHPFILERVALTPNNVRQDVGTMRIWNNVFSRDSDERTTIVLRGAPGTGGVIHLYLYNRTGLPIWEIDTVGLDPDGVAVVDFSNMPLPGTGVFWVVARGAVNAKQRILVLR